MFIYVAFSFTHLAPGKFEPPLGMPTVFDPSFKGIGQKVGLEIWRVEALKVVKKSGDDKCYQGQFHEGDAYIVLQTKVKRVILSYFLLLLYLLSRW